MKRLIIILAVLFFTKASAQYISLTEYNVLPENDGNTNRVNLTNAIASVPDGTILYGDLRNPIRIDSTILITRSNIELTYLNIESEIDPNTGEPYIFHQFWIQGAQHVNFRHTYHEGHGELVNDDANRRAAIYYFQSNHCVVQDIRGHQIRKNLVTFEQGRDFTARDIFGDHVRRDCVSIVSAQQILLDNIHADNSVLRGAFEFSDNTYDAVARNIYASNCAYVFDIDIHGVTQNNGNILIDGVYSDSNHVVCNTLGNAICFNIAFRNFYIRNTQGNLDYADQNFGGDIHLDSHVNGITLDNINFLNRLHTKTLIYLGHVDNVLLNNIRVSDTAKNRIIYVRDGATATRGKRININNVFCDNYESSNSAIYINDFSDLSTANLKVNLTPTCTGQKLELVNITGAIGDDNTVSGKAGYTLVAVSNNMTPADGQTLNMGFNYLSSGSGANVNPMPVITSGTIKKVVVTCHNSGTLGSGESSQFSLKVAGVLYPVTTTLKNNASITRGVNYTMNIPVVENQDFIEGVFTGATWITNPTGVRFSVLIYIEQN